MKSLFLVVAVLSFCISTPALALVNASSLKLKVFTVAISESTACDDPIVIFDSPSAQEVDFLNNPNLGNGEAPDGTYNCVIIRMSDTIKFTPETTEGSCTAGVENDLDICIANGTTTTEFDPVSAEFGSNVSCTGAGNLAVGSDTVTVFMTTNSPAGGSTTDFTKPTSESDTTNGINLASPLIVGGVSNTKFVANANGKVDGSAGQCAMNPPDFSFAAEE